jgi:hypothetical protein
LPDDLGRRVAFNLCGPRPAASGMIEIWVIAGIAMSYT